MSKEIIQTENYQVKVNTAATGISNLPGEEWKAIEGAQLYWISNLGRVKRLGYWTPDASRYYSEKLVKQTENSNTGFNYVNIKKDNGKQRYVAVHTLVAEAFIPNPLGYTWVFNLNGNLLDNCVENLAWIPHGHTEKQKEKTKAAYQEKNARYVQVEVDELVFPTKKSAASFLGISDQRIKRYLDNSERMPPEYKTRGLRYYNPMQIAASRCCTK